MPGVYPLNVQQATTLKCFGPFTSKAGVHTFLNTFRNREELFEDTVNLKMIRWMFSTDT